MTPARLCPQGQREAGIGQSRQFRGAARRFERPGVARQSAFRVGQSARQPRTSPSRRRRIESRRRSPQPSIRRSCRRPPRRPPAMTSEFPDPKPVRTVSLRPDGTPIGASSPPDADRQASCDSPPRAAAAETRRASSVAARRSTTKRHGRRLRSLRRPNSNCPPSFLPKSSARVVVGENRHDRAGRERTDAERAERRPAR